MMVDGSSSILNMGGVGNRRGGNWVEPRLIGDRAITNLHFRLQTEMDKSEETVHPTPVKTTTNDVEESTTKPKCEPDIGEALEELANDKGHSAPDIHKLPVNIFVKILQYLPFQEQVRVDRVNRRFRQISRISVSLTKSLRLGNDLAGRFSSIPPSSLESILGLCAGNLESIWVSAFVYGRTHPVLEKLAEYSFRHLTKFEVKNISVGERVFSRLIENNPNLEDICCEIERDRRVVFPSGVYEKLERVKFEPCDDRLVRSMIGKVPNLKQFCCCDAGSICVSTWNDFFGCVPKLEILDMPLVDFHRVTNLWKLSSLIWLQVYHIGGSDVSPIEDDLLENISSRFPQLRTLGFYYAARITARGIRALAGLKELRILSSIPEIDPDNDATDAIEKLSACGNLELISIVCNVSTSALISLIRFCPNLRSVTLWKISDTPEAISAMLDSLLAIGQRKRISIQLSKYPRIWTSDLETAKLAKLRENGINFGNPVEFVIDDSEAEYDSDQGDGVDSITDSDED